VAYGHQTFVLHPSFVAPEVKLFLKLNIRKGITSLKM
jgi:hypothetical protein